MAGNGAKGGVTGDVGADGVTFGFGPAGAIGVDGVLEFPTKGITGVGSIGDGMVTVGLTAGFGCSFMVSGAS